MLDFLSNIIPLVIAKGAKIIFPGTESYANTEFQYTALLNLFH